MLKNSYPSLAAIGLAIASFSGGAAQASDMTEVVVTVKTNQSLTDVLATSHVFDQQDIEASQANDIPALLDQLAGVSVRDSGGRGSVTGVFVRGTSNTQTIVLIDGVRVGSATLGSAALNAYPIEAIARIEVVKGPLSGIYGADAAGGVIQLFTKKNSDGLGTASLTVGSDSLREVGLSLNGGNQKHSFNIAVHSEETDGIDRTSILTDGNDDRDGFEQRAFSFAGKTTLSDNTVANLSVLYSDNTAEFDNTFGSDPGLKTDSETLSAALNINTQLSDNLSWRNIVGHNEDESATNGAFASNFTTDRDTANSELSINLNGQNHLTVGVDYYQESIKSSNDYTLDERDNTGIFALYQTQLGALGLVANLRYDDNSAYDNQTNGSIAVNLDLTENIRAVASFGTAFIAPSFNSLYFPNFGNKDIKPEESESIEVSLLGNTESLNWRVSAYKNDIKNLFSFDPATFLAANIGAAELEGVELEINTTVANWLLGLNLDLLSAKNKDTGVELDDRAERSVSISAKRTFDRLELQADLKGESKRFDNRGTELSSYGLFNIQGSYKISDQLSVQAKVDNLFDKDYIINLLSAPNYYNTLGRKAQLTLKYNF